MLARSAVAQSPLMKSLIAACVALVAVGCSRPSATGAPPDAARWEERAAAVTITRDDWGIAHVHGKTDADAVFGMIYAQAEDDFNRIETNYLTSLGRLAETEGESAIWRDLRMKIFTDPAVLKTQYAAAPAWLQALMNGWADGLNYYLHSHPEVKPRVITRFEPWMALSFSEGSIGGDIERVNLRTLERFYANVPTVAATGRGVDDSHALETGLQTIEEPTGSNGFAIAPQRSASKRALLWINPHTSFFFRSELQMSSDEGLNAYGAVTWGQFFVYQGFNERAGWMHTSSSVDNIDEYAETVLKKGDGYAYHYGNEERPLIASTITVPFKTASGMAERTFTVYRTHHGPIVRENGGKWIAVRLMQEPLKALTQSYSRTRARNYKEFRQSLELHTNSSNNTVYADADGTIAYFHSNFIPKRDTSFDWTKPVDGTNPKTEWGALLSIDETPLVVNPTSGFVFNTNNAPWSAAGRGSRDTPKQQDYPAFVDSGSENPRGEHALQVLNRNDFTLETLRAAAFDSFLPEFAVLKPALVKAYDALPATSPLKTKLSGPVSSLRAWDCRWAANSVATSVAVFWGEEMWARSVTTEINKAGTPSYRWMETEASPAIKLDALSVAVDKLTADFGRWDTPWGDINRFQRLTGDIVHPFDDKGPSIPVPFTSARWGSLASFGARAQPGTKKWYGTTGNSFVAAAEFGERVRAKAVTAGGESGDPKSPHFNDQAERYASGNLRDVYFYPDELKPHTTRTYHPGK
jgi:acyl-homoserine lactone acylase PvdQ